MVSRRTSIALVSIILLFFLCVFTTRAIRSKQVLTTAVSIEKRNTQSFVNRSISLKERPPTRKITVPGTRNGSETNFYRMGFDLLFFIFLHI